MLRKRYTMEFRVEAVRQVTERGIQSDRSRALAREVDHDRQSPESPAVRQAVLHEVHRPALVGPAGNRQRRCVNFQVLRGGEPKDPLVIYPGFVAPKQHGYAAVPEAGRVS
jgi:hypothetical protein